MSTSLNKVFLAGNLAQEPDFRGLPSGQSVCVLRVATNRKYMYNGKEQEEVCFTDVVVWGKSATNCRQYLTKGSSVLVEGRLQYEAWEDRNGGGHRSRLRVVADRVQFLGSPRRGDMPADNPDDNSAPPPQQYQQNNAYQAGGYGNNYANNYAGSGNYQNNYGSPMPMPPQQFQQNMPEAPQDGAGSEQPPEDDIPF